MQLLDQKTQLSFSEWCYRNGALRYSLLLSVLLGGVLLSLLLLFLLVSVVRCGACSTEERIGVGGLDHVVSTEWDFEVSNLVVSRDSAQLLDQVLGEEVEGLAFGETLRCSSVGELEVVVTVVGLIVTAFAVDFLRRCSAPADDEAVACALQNLDVVVLILSLYKVAAPFIGTSRYLETVNHSLLQAGRVLN